MITSFGCQQQIDNATPVELSKIKELYLKHRARIAEKMDGMISEKEINKVLLDKNLKGEVAVLISFLKLQYEDLINLNTDNANFKFFLSHDFK